jgi:hypothetical protein
MAQMTVLMEVMCRQAAAAVVLVLSLNQLRQIHCGMKG